MTSTADKIRFRCHACGAVFKAPASIVGKSRPCPKCEAPVHFPEPDGNEPVSTVAPGSKANAAKPAGAKKKTKTAPGDGPKQKNASAAAGRAKRKGSASPAESEAGGAAAMLRDRRVLGGIGGGVVLLIVVLVMALGGSGDNDDSGAGPAAGGNGPSSAPAAPAGPLADRVGTWAVTAMHDLSLPAEGGARYGYTCRALGISPDGRLIATFGQGKEALRLFGLDGSPKWSGEDPGGMFIWEQIFVGNDGSCFYTAHELMGRPATGDLQRFEGTTAVSANGEWGVACKRESFANTTRVINRSTLAIQEIAGVGKGEGDAIDNAYSIAVSNDGRTVFTGMYDGIIEKWSAGGQKLGTAEWSDEDAPETLAVSADGKWLAAQAEKSIHLYDATTMKHARQLDGLDGNVTRLYFTADGRKLVARKFQGAVEIWDLASGDHQSVDHNRDMAVSPDLTVVAVFSPREVSFLDLSGKPLGKVALKSMGGSNGSMCFLPDQSGMVVGYGERMFIIGPSTP